MYVGTKPLQKVTFMMEKLFVKDNYIYNLKIEDEEVTKVAGGGNFS